MLTNTLNWLHRAFIHYLKPASLLTAILSTFFFCLLSMAWSFGVLRTAHMLTEMVPWKFLLNFSIFSFLSSLVLYVIWNWAAESHIIRGRSRISAVSIIIFLTVILTSLVRLLSQISFAVWFSAGKNWFEGIKLDLTPDLLWAWKKQLLIFPRGEIKIGADEHSIYSVNWTYNLDPILILAVVVIFLTWRYKSP